MPPFDRRKRVGLCRLQGKSVDFRDVDLANQDPGRLHRLIDAVRKPQIPYRDEEEKWNDVRLYALKYPKNVMHMDDHGRSALMASIASRAPLEVVKTLLDHTHVGMECARDKTGLTALFLAIENDLSLPSIEYLLSRNGIEQLMTRDSQESLPLHSILSRFHRSELLDEDPDRREYLMDLFLLLGPAEQQCLYENNLGLTPLHVALESKMPFSIVKKLVQACPQAVSRQGCGYTPLVAAIREDASLLTIEYLISIDSRIAEIRDIEGKYPLRRCIDRRNHDRNVLEMLCTCPQAVTTRDIFGRNLLQLLLEQWTTSTGLVDPDVVRLFLQIAPEVARDSRFGNMVVGVDACMSPLRLCYEPYKDAVGALDHAQPRRREDAEKLSQAWWEIMHEIMYAMQNQFESPLRAAISCDAPKEIVERLLREHKEYAHVKDASGSLPLHWIFRRHNPNDSRNEYILMILRTAPEIAGIPDSDGRFAMHLLIERGGFPREVFRELVKAYPQALTTRDTRYGLPPFAVAATVQCRSSGRDEKIDETKNLAQLEAIYSLLKDAPQVLMAGR